MGGRRRGGRRHCPSVLGYGLVCFKCTSATTYSAIGTFCVLGTVLGSGLHASHSVSSSVNFSSPLSVSPTNRQPQTFSTMTLTGLLGRPGDLNCLYIDVLKKIHIVF